jgi:hypothetical protein
MHDNNDKRETASSLANNFSISFLPKIYDESRSFLISNAQIPSPGPPQCGAAAGLVCRRFPRAGVALRAAYAVALLSRMRAQPLVWLSEGLGKLACGFARSLSKGALPNGQPEGVV